LKVVAKILGIATLFLAGIFAAQMSARSPQGVDANRPVFDTTSVKPNKSGSGNISVNAQPGGRLVATNATVEMLINIAYQLKSHQLVGGPHWLGSEHFDIEARAAVNPNREQMALMMQSLLGDRFKLVVHHETRLIPFYALVLAKAGRMGPQLLAHSDDRNCADRADGPPVGPPRTPCDGFRVANGHVAAGKITMEMLSRTLSNFVDRVVLDRTDLKGSFDVDFTFSGQQLLLGGQRAGPDPNSPDPSSAPSLFAALPEQLGLKLEAQTGPVDVLVIDHVEPPSEN
jgi:uncharacterized protein (TIGR03435 family)